MADTQPDPPTDAKTSKAKSLEHKRLRQAVLASPLTAGEFRAKHKSGLAALWRELDQRPDLDAVPPPVSQVMYELRRCRLVHLMRSATKDNCPEVYSELLTLLLEQVDVRPPAGVLVPPRGEPGRPRGILECQIHSYWVAIGKPSLNWRTLDKLAREFYPEEFAKTTPDRGRKRLRDRVRATILRSTPATKSTLIS